MKNKGMLFPIALVVAIVISATSMALAATSPLDGLGITIPSVGSDITIPSVGSDTTIPTDGTTIPVDSTGGSGFTEPTAAFTVTQTTWKTPFNMSFTDKSTGTIFMRNWDFGDGNTSTDQNPVHSYAAAGKYNVTLQAMGAGSNAITKVITVAASKPSTSKAPVAAFTTSVSGKTVKFTDKSTGSPKSYLWDFGDKSTSTTKNPTHQYKKAGKYTVTLTAKNSAGSNKKTGTVTVK
jgi:PKD repeat protein